MAKGCPEKEKSVSMLHHKLVMTSIKQHDNPNRDPDHIDFFPVICSDEASSSSMNADVQSGMEETWLGILSPARVKFSFLAVTLLRVRCSGMKETD